MLFSSTTDVYGGLSQITSLVFNDTYSYLILIIGIILGFFIIETLINISSPKTLDVESQYNKVMKDVEITRSKIDWNRLDELNGE